MLESEVIPWADEQLRQQIERVRAAVAVGPERANKRTPAEAWSAYEVLDHLIITDRIYGAVIQPALAKAPAAPGDRPIRNSFIGRYLVKAAGPGGNAPAPGPFRPQKGTYGPEIVDEWVAVAEKSRADFQRAIGKDLNAFIFRNPMAKMFRMNLADWITITVAHTERHVQQIEERTR